MSPVGTGLELIADIGGTNARFALTDPAAPHPVVLQPMSVCNAEFASLQHAAEHYLAAVGVRPRRAAIAVASPVGDDEIRLTNRAWSFSRHELRESLQLDELLLLNDFGAVALAVPALAARDCVALYGPASMPPRGPITVIGPGTGLGVALLVGGQDDWHVAETEGGHVTFAPIGEEEQAIARWLTAHYGRASNERVLCGKGLSHIDAVLRGTGIAAAPRHDNRATRNAVADPPAPAPALRDPAAIVAAALEGHDLAARRALARFCAVLGSVAGHAALIHGARTVLIAGGIVPRFVPFLRSSAFRERFLAKGRFTPYLESVAIQIVVHPHPGMLGAAVALRPGRRQVAS